MRRRLASAAAAALIAAVAAAGCSGTGAGAGAGTGGRELTAAEEFRIDRAEELLVQECMADRGFRYWAKGVEPVALRRGHGYLLDDPGWARKHGYGGELRRRAEETGRNAPLRAYLRSMPEAERIRYTKALDGDLWQDPVSVELPGGGTVQTARNGCRARSQEQLYGDFPAWFRVHKTVTSLDGLYVPDLVKDERFGRAVASWSACMREAGHRYADPPAIRARLPELTEGLGPARAHAAEVELATAEVRCATSTPLSRTAHALDREYRRKQLRPYREDIAAHQRLQAAALSRAEDVTGRSA